jgi:hypothetical protein
MALGCGWTVAGVAADCAVRELGRADEYRFLNPEDLPAARPEHEKEQQG